MPLSPEEAINQNRKSNQPISSANVLNLESNHGREKFGTHCAFKAICAICNGMCGYVRAIIYLITIIRYPFNQFLEKDNILMQRDILEDSLLFNPRDLKETIDR